MHPRAAHAFLCRTRDNDLVLNEELDCDLMSQVARQEKKPNDAMILGKGASVSLTGGLAVQVLGMAVQILMARLLGAAAFGLYSVGWTLLRLLSPVTTLGLEAGVTFFGARYLRFSATKFKGVVRESITIAFLSGATIGIALYLAAPVLAEHVFHKPDTLMIIRGFGPAFPLYGVLIVSGVVTRLSHRMQYALYSSLAFTAFALIFFLVLFICKWGVMGAVLSTVGGIAIGAMISVCFIMLLFPSTFAKEIRPEWVCGELLAYSAPLALSALAGSMLTFVDRLFIASFCSSADVGLYQVASQLSLFFVIAYGAFDSIFSPMAADLHARGENKRLGELYRVCTKWGLYVSAPVFLVILFAPAQLVECTYGSPYVNAATPLVILSLGKLFLMTTAISASVLLMTGRQTIVVALPLAVLPIDLFLNFILARAFGLVGAAVATTISAVILNAALIIAVWKQLGIWLFGTRYLKAALAASASCGFLYILRPIPIGIPALRLLLTAGTSLAAFTGALLFLGLDAEDWEIVDLLRVRFQWSAPQPITDGGS
jgi:O-antigen/teichoic acid export membrane protein